MRWSARLSAQTTMKLPSERRARAGLISGSTGDVETWISGPDSVSASKMRSFSCVGAVAALPAACSFQATTKPDANSTIAGSCRRGPGGVGRLIRISLLLLTPLVPNIWPLIVLLLWSSHTATNCVPCRLQTPGWL